MESIEGRERGDFSEFKVATDLLENGCRVSYTFGEYPYDLIADLEGELHKIQVKTANHDRNRRYEIKIDGYSASNVDYFAGYAPGEDDVFYVTFSRSIGSNQYGVTFTPSEELSEVNEERAKLAEEHGFDEIIRE